MSVLFYGLVGGREGISADVVGVAISAVVRGEGCPVERVWEEGESRVGVV